MLSPQLNIVSFSYCNLKKGGCIFNFQDVGQIDSDALGLSVHRDALGLSVQHSHAGAHRDTHCVSVQHSHAGAHRDTHSLPVQHSISIYR
jgi:hypothetical protein